MSDSEYRGGSTAGGRWGCACAALIGTPLFVILLIGDALGDCVSGEVCHKGFLQMVLLPTVLTTVPVGLGVRWIVNRARGHGS